MSIADAVSFLFVPAHRPDRFAKAAAAGPDAIILDLEDAVPEAAKAEARAALETGFSTGPVLVRINAAGTPWHGDDIEAVRVLRPTALMLPKAEQVDTLDRVAAQAPGLPIVALIESAAGLAAARALAAHPAVARLAFGSVDFCADLGCAHIREALASARAELVLAARLAGRPGPIDGVTTAIADAAQVTDDARHARALGFTGKLAIHPQQIAPLNAGFRPTDDEIAWARKVLASGDGAAAVDGAMVDAPVRTRARTTLARAGMPVGAPSRSA